MGKDGSVRCVISNYGIVRGADGRAITGHGATWDVTERQDIEDRLRRFNHRAVE